MAFDESHLILKIETNNPVELSEFVGAFIGFGNQFESYYDYERPSERGNARFYVREVRAGSIIAELVPYLVPAAPLLGGTLAAVKHANELAKFVETYGGKVRNYFKRGGRDPAGSLSLAVYEEGEQRVAFQFSTHEAKEAEHNLLEHRAELEKTTEADHRRVLMVFTRTNVAHATTGKRSGELVEIETIHGKALPIVYASSLAEERIRHEIAEADDNVYKKAFDVDVNVELRAGKPVAYRLVAVHNVIDLPD